MKSKLMNYKKRIWKQKDKDRMNKEYQEIKNHGNK